MKLRQQALHRDAPSIQLAFEHDRTARAVSQDGWFNEQAPDSRFLARLFFHDFLNLRRELRLSGSRFGLFRPLFRSFFRRSGALMLLFCILYSCHHARRCVHVVDLYISPLQLRQVHEDDGHAAHEQHVERSSRRSRTR